MEPSKVVGVAAAATLAVAIVVGVALESKVPPESKGDIVAVSLIESKVAWLDDGTKVYRVPVVLRDGGIAYDEKAASEAPCKRRPKGAKDCNRTHTDLKGVEVTEEAPELNRYPAASMSGAGCEGCACSIFLGEDAEAEEKPPAQRR